MFQFITPAYRATKLQEFHNHRTVFFSLTTERTVEIDRIFANRIGFEKPPTTMKNRQVNMGMVDGTTWAHTARADLIVTDNPQDIYGYIDAAFYQRMKLPELIENARIMLGKEIANWAEIAALQPQDRAVILTQPLMQMCNFRRVTEGELLGYQRMTWEQFSKEYTTIVQSSDVLAFPTAQHKSFLLSTYYDPSTPAVAIVFGDHREQGEELCWIVQLTEMGELFTPRNRKSTLYRPDDYQAMSDRLAEITSVNAGHLTIGDPKMNFATAPSVLRNVQVSHFMKSTMIDLPKLTDIARGLGLRGYSSKTKAELSIMVGEKLAEMTASNMTPALMFDSMQQFSDAAPIDQTMQQAGEHVSPVDYYTFASRVISHAAYVPGAEASPAGRIPTDGQFPAYFGIEPLDIITPDF